MGKLLCDPSGAAVAEALPPSPAPAPPPQLLTWHSPAPAPALALEASTTSPTGWDAVWALEDQQRRRLHRIWERGVAWKPSFSSPGGGEEEGAAPAPVVVFRLDHGGEVDADGNCLFTAARTAAAAKAGARELRHRAVRRFAEVYDAAGEEDRAAVDAAVRHLYAPDLKAGWGVHVVQEIKVLAPKAQRDALDAAIQELVDLGIQRYPARAAPGSRLSAKVFSFFSFFLLIPSRHDLKASPFFILLPIPLFLISSEHMQCLSCILERKTKSCFPRQICFALEIES
jgi:hypothetical protein